MGVDVDAEFIVVVHEQGGDTDTEVQPRICARSEGMAELPPLPVGRSLKAAARIGTQLFEFVFGQTATLDELDRMTLLDELRERSHHPPFVVLEILRLTSVNLVALCADEDEAQAATKGIEPVTDRS